VLYRLVDDRRVTSGLSARLRVGYALGGIATGSFGTVPGLLLLPYLTDSLGIGPALAGVIVFLPKAWDVIVNPITGRLSDRSSSANGSRRPFLLWGGLALAAGFALLFSGPDAPRWLAGGWVAVTFLLCATAYSAFQVPYVAMPAELTDDYAERTRLLSWRVAILAVAILASGASGPMIRNAVGGAAGYRSMAIFVAVLIMAGALGAYAGTAGARTSTIPSRAGSLRTQLRQAWRVRDFRLLLITFVVQSLAIGCLLAGVDYVSRTVLHDPGASSVLFACFVGPAVIVTPVWQRAADRLGKKSGYLLGSLIFAAGVASLAMIGSAPAIVGYLLAGVAGAGYAGCQLFPLAMMPDTAAHDARRTGENRVGLLTGVWTAGETLGLALGPAVFALVLTIGGYRSSTAGDPVQPASAIVAITAGFSLLPAILILISLLALRGYALTPGALRDALALPRETDQ
jgi:glycoside/pentoside/hexuronide:cation symporter, GPH family